jgi:hypothetical protein
VKISAGISWNSMNHEISGFCDEVQDFTAIFNKNYGVNNNNGGILHNKLATYINQWKIVSEDSSFSSPIEFYSSSCPIKSESLIMQLHHVLLFLEISNIHVHAICCDAGTANGKLFRLMRSVQLPDPITIDLSHDMTSFIHSFSQTRCLVYIFHCMVHGLEAIRNNLEKSRKLKFTKQSIGNDKENNTQCSTPVAVNYRETESSEMASIMKLNNFSTSGET